MLILARDRRLMGEHRSGRLSLTVVGLTVVASVLAPVAWVLAS
jgi:hypothetical protein